MRSKYIEFPCLGALSLEERKKKRMCFFPLRKKEPIKLKMFNTKRPRDAFIDCLATQLYPWFALHLLHMAVVVSCEETSMAKIILASFMIVWKEWKFSHIVLKLCTPKTVCHISVYFRK